jgi:2-polyprenyl-3-methyl-5-hydroxy-6-metoxy-1,4-benzoquinol methylase
MTQPTNRDSIQAWNAAAGAVAPVGEEGDPARQYLLNPALFQLMGDVMGKRILDAGCGQGYLARLLARRGAHMTGLEPAENWLAQAQAQERAHPLGITYLQADLSTWQPQDQFDLVVANMVLMDIPDYQTAMQHCMEVVTPGGTFLFSLLHPCFEESSALWATKGYVEVREYLREEVKPQQFGYLFHRPLSAYLNVVAQAGLCFSAMIEPQLPEEIATQLQHWRNAHVPNFVVIAAHKHR